MITGKAYGIHSASLVNLETGKLTELTGIRDIVVPTKAASDETFSFEGNMSVTLEFNLSPAMYLTLLRMMGYRIIPIKWIKW